MNAPRMRHVIGCMCGTSLDAIDASLVRLEGEGLTMSVAVTGAASIPMPDDLQTRLRAFACGEAWSIEAVLAARAALSQAHVHVIGELRHDGPPVDLIAAHGQTVYHAPPLSCQLLDPTIIAHATGINVVTDLRAADLAHGGQGAPITPLADAILFGDPNERRNIVNLGGFCNITHLPRWGASEADLAAIAGSDICACNQVLDEIARVHLDRPFDENGEIAAAGTVDPGELDVLIEMLQRQRDERRSLGSGDEMLTWARARTKNPANRLATACEAIGTVIGEVLRDAGAETIIVAGGGARNATLVGSIQRHADRDATPIDTLVAGMDVQDREAVCMAILGALCEDHVPITLPQVTGCHAPAPVAGVWTFA